MRASNLALVSSISRCIGTPLFIEMNGSEIDVFVTPERSIFAFSDASLILCIAILSPERSMPWDFLNSATT